MIQLAGSESKSAAVASKDDVMYRAPWEYYRRAVQVVSHPQRFRTEPKPTQALMLHEATHS